MDDTPERMDADEVVFTHGPVPPGEPTTPVEEAVKADALEGVYHGMTLPNEEDVPDGAPGCQRCEVLPAPIRGPGTLELRLPHTYSLGKVLEFLTHSPWEHGEHEGTISIHIPPGSLAPLLAPILDRLSSTEQRDARAHFRPDGALPQAEDRFEIEALPAFAVKARSEWLLDILRSERLYSVFQPIVSCADPAVVHGHECLMRAEVEGGPVSPGLMLDLADGAGLLFQLDLAARRSAIVSAAGHALADKVFINFTPNAIYAPHSCLNSTVRMVDELRLGRGQVVFEVIESERLPDLKHLRRIVDFYREQGFGVALDDVGAGYSSLSALLELRPDYVKIDRALIDKVDEQPDKALVAGKLLEAAQGLGLRTIAEGIERREEWEWARAHGADFAQGYLFARPAARARLALSQERGLFGGRGKLVREEAVKLGSTSRRARGPFRQRAGQWADVARQRLFGGGDDLGADNFGAPGRAREVRQREGKHDTGRGTSAAPARTGCAPPGGGTGRRSRARGAPPRPPGCGPAGR